jgi:outer membrane lipoprotein-sorting protein
MKKVLLFAISAVIFASCSTEATNEQLTFFGASIGMEKREALDSLSAHEVYDIDSTNGNLVGEEEPIRLIISSGNRVSI